MENEDKPLGLLYYIKPTFEDSLFSKVMAMTNNDTPWAERWSEPEFDQQGWKEVMGKLSNMAGEIAQNTKVTKEDLESGGK